jgi:hypothetical protein
LEAEVGNTGEHVLFDWYFVQQASICVRRAAGVEGFRYTKRMNMALLWSLWMTLTWFAEVLEAK